ncbi:MAG: aminopeptidase P N-terminal domain-containing protein [Myxococcota bacterium]
MSVRPIPAHVYVERRKRFREQIGEGVALIPGAGLKRRTADIDFPFRQHSDLLYVSGFDQPDAAAVITRDRFVMFVQPRDPDAETWTGIRPGIDGACEQFGADEAYPISELDEKLPGLIENVPRLFYPFGEYGSYDQRVVRALEAVRRRARKGATAPRDIADPRAILHEMRLFKSPEEIEIMRAAAEISREAHRSAARLCQPGHHEYEVEAELIHTFRRRGGSGPAYPSIVGSGENGTILHYIENGSRIEPGQLVLIDAGTELHGYASDVTRTYPVGGSFEGAARDVYSLVLEAQKAGLREVRPGSTLPTIHDRVVRTLVEGLVELGALEGDSKTLIEQTAYTPFYMHSTSHWLGLDVHDVGDYQLEGKPRTLEAGMVFTVEPGLYFPSRDERTPEHLRGIGVRIEDDIVVTDEGFENLTASIPKEPEEVEAWVRA